MSYNNTYIAQGSTKLDSQEHAITNKNYDKNRPDDVERYLRMERVNHLSVNEIFQN